ncbi:hypothetical protein ABEB36_015301 [Hypothenemus hampei]|uniref:Uncharacterized protein n=1 Tax=Hypothenemus hampei TaxID=57062 RepID=A0ABD1E4E0_HYPHA
MVYYPHHHNINLCRVTPQKPVRSLQELTLEIPEEILSAKRVSGKFGPQILLELKESIVFFELRGKQKLIF